MRHKWGIGLLVFGMLVTNYKAEEIKLQSGHVYVTQMNAGTKDLTTGQLITNGYSDAYDEKTRTLIHFSDEEIWDSEILYKYNANGEEEELIKQDYLDDVGEKLNGFIGVKNGFAYVNSYKYGANNTMTSYINKVDINTGKVIQKYNVTDYATKPLICNNKAYFAKQSNGICYVMVNDGQKTNRLIEGVPVGFYKNYLYVVRNDKEVFTYDINTGKKQGLLQLGPNDTYYIDSDLEDSIFYCIKNSTLMKYVPGASSKICTLGNGAPVNYTRITDVLETNNQYFIGVILGNWNTGVASVKLLQIDKKSKQKTVLYESKVITEYMPGVFYITDIALSNNILYFNAPVLNTNYYTTVNTKGMSYNLKTGELIKQDDEWLNVITVK